MRHYRLFQAWQSQNKEYTDFVTRSIQDVVAKEKNKGIEIEVIRYPAQDEAGSPDVVDMVWEQIANSDIFVGDLTEIVQSGDYTVSNPNVMYEVGIADALLGEKRVILLCSKDTEINRLAFDINHKRISPLCKNDTHAKKLLREWIESAIVECDLQQVQKDFIFKDLYDDLYVIYNNFMRIIYSDDYIYSLGVYPPGIEKIKNRLKESVLNELMITIDYGCVIERIKAGVKALYASNNRRLLEDIINVYKALDKYNWFVHSVDKSVLLNELDRKYNFLLQDNNTFFLNTVNGAEEAYESILFEKKYIYISGEHLFQNVFLKEMFTEKVISECHIQNCSTNKGTVTEMNTKTYMIMPNAINSYGQYLNDVLVTIYSFMDKMNFCPTNKTPYINSDTIIVWNKSK